MESWDATRRVSEEGYDDRLDDACDECATGLLVRVRVPSSYVSPPASRRHRTRARASRQARLTFDVPTVSEQVARFVRSAGYCVAGLSLARAVRASQPPRSSGASRSSYLGTLRRRSTPLPLWLRLERRIFASLDSWSGTHSNSLDWESLFATPTPALYSNQGHPRAILHYDRDDYIYLSLAEFSLNSTQFLSGTFSLLLSYTYSVIRDARLHARTHKGYFYFSVLYCTVVYLISLA